MLALQENPVHCPYCGEAFVMLLDGSAGGQEYFEDCPVCCRPISVIVSPRHDGDFAVEVRREDEA